MIFSSPHSHAIFSYYFWSLSLTQLNSSLLFSTSYSIYFFSYPLTLTHYVNFQKFYHSFIRSSIFISIAYLFQFACPCLFMLWFMMGSVVYARCVCGFYPCSCLFIHNSFHSWCPFLFHLSNLKLSQNSPDLSLNSSLCRPYFS